MPPRKRGSLYKKKVGALYIFVLTSEDDFLVVYERKVRWRRNRRQIELVKRYLAYIYRIKKAEYYIVLFEWFIPHKDMMYIVKQNDVGLQLKMF